MNGIKRLGLDKINRLGLENNGANNFQKTLSIKFISASVDDKNKNITFEISASNLSTDKATIYVQEMNYTNESAVPLTNIIINPNGKKNVTVSFSKDKKFDNYFWQSGYSYKATINCDGQSASTEEFNIPDVSKAVSNKGAGIDNNDPRNFPKKACKALNLTEKQKAQIIAVVLAESALGDPPLYDIGYIYPNLINRYGFERGMQLSSAYKNKSPNFKLFMYYLKQGDEYKDFVYYSSKMTLEKYIKNNPFLTVNQPKIKPLQDFLEKEIFCKNPTTPYYKWCGQGYTGDFNRNDENSSGKWYRARQYYWLQESKKVTNIWVKVLVATNKNDTTYLFDEDSIIDFFVKNPTLLPSPDKIPFVK